MCRHDHGQTSFVERDRTAEKLLTQIATAGSLSKLEGFSDQAATYVGDAQAKAVAIDLGSANRVRVLSAVADFYGNTSAGGAALVAALDFLKESVKLPAGGTNGAARPQVEEVEEDDEDEDGDEDDSDES